MPAAGLTTKISRQSVMKLKYIPEIQAIQMRQDIKMLVEEYRFTHVSIGKYAGCSDRAVREFYTNPTRSLSKENHNKLYRWLSEIKEVIEETENKGDDRH